MTSREVQPRRLLQRGSQKYRHLQHRYELGSTTGIVFQIFANNNLDIKINTLFDTGAMKSVMSLKMYKKLKLNYLNTSSIPHVVGVSGEELRRKRKN